MDAYQDYSSVKRRIVKPSKKWCAPNNKPKELKTSSNTSQNTYAFQQQVYLRQCSSRKDRNKRPLPRTTNDDKSPDSQWQFRVWLHSKGNAKNENLTLDTA